MTRLETQCWICPKCNDDHDPGKTCGIYFPPDEFMPAEGDKSYIAEQYRLRVAENTKLKRFEEIYDNQVSRILELEAELDLIKQGNDDVLPVEVLKLRAENEKLKIINDEMSEAWKLKCNAYDLMREACEQFRAENAELREFVVAVSMPAYVDSDLRSLLDWMQSRAKALLGDSEGKVSDGTI